MFGRLWLRYRRQIFIVVLFIAPVIPLLLLKVELPNVSVYDSVSSWVVHPMAEFGTNLTRGASKIWARYLALVHTSEENDGLKSANQNLRNEILSLKESAQENERLKKVLEMQDIPGFHRVTAKVIGQDASSESLAFVINVGTSSGLRPRQPVITPEGVAGTVIRAYAHSAVFVTIADPSHDLDGVITRSRARFIVEGRGYPMAGRLKYLDRAEDIRVGDLVITSGLDGVFPKGILVGSIIKVDRPKTGVVQEAEIRSAVDFGKMEEVMVLIPQVATASGDERKFAR